MSRPAVMKIRKTIAAVRTTWLVFGLTLLLLLALEFGLRGMFAIKDRLSKPATPDPRVVRDGYGGEIWPIQHYRELEALADRWEPYAYFRQRPFRGETITIDDLGQRAVWRPPNLETSPQPLKILTLGGSALWGFGARDDRTIPSLLARALQDEGIVADIRNLAEIGYVNTQELVALIRELQSGYRPDLVLFYDGVNDATSALLEGAPALTTNERNRVREFNLLQSPGRMAAELSGALIRGSALQRVADSIRLRLFGVHPVAIPSPSEDELDALARGVVEGYLANLDMIEALADRHGFRPVFIWQPVVFDKARQTDFEKEEAAKFAWTAPIFAKVADEIHQSQALGARPNFLDLGGVFGDSPDLMFIDYCHVTEEGNARIVRAIVERLREFLPAPAVASPH